MWYKIINKIKEKRDQNKTNLFKKVKMGLMFCLRKNFFMNI